MERRKHPRVQILVDLEIAVGRHAVCHGVATNISNEGASLHIEEPGELPDMDTPVILNFKIWTGRERLCRAVNARVARVEGSDIGLQFLGNDSVDKAAIEDLLFYLKLDERHTIYAA